MGKSTITVTLTLDDSVIESIDKLVENSVYPNRSMAIRKAVERKFKRIDDAAFERELAKMDPEFERRMAEEFLPMYPSEWTEY